MSKLSRGEREFVSDPDRVQQPAPPAAAGREPSAAGAVRELDARSASAPLPLLQAHRTLRGMRVGEELRVLTAYQGSLAEFQALAKHDISVELVSQDITGDGFVHLLRKRR